MASDYEVTHLAKHNPDGNPNKKKKKIQVVYCERKCGRDQCVFKCNWPTIKK